MNFCIRLKINEKEYILKRLSLKGCVYKMDFKVIHPFGWFDEF